MSKEIDKVEFPSPNEENGYDLFNLVLESDSNVYFHGTAQSVLESILKNGFHSTGDLPSSSFATKSKVSLGYACNARDKSSPTGVVIAVRFTAEQLGKLRQEGDAAYLDNPAMQPQILCYCEVPSDYNFV